MPSPASGQFPRYSAPPNRRSIQYSDDESDSDDTVRPSDSISTILTQPAQSKRQYQQTPYRPGNSRTQAYRSAPASRSVAYTSYQPQFSDIQGVRYTNNEPSRRSQQTTPNQQEKSILDEWSRQQPTSSLGTPYGKPAAVDTSAVHIQDSGPWILNSASPAYGSDLDQGAGDRNAVASNALTLQRSGQRRSIGGRGDFDRLDTSSKLSEFYRTSPEVRRSSISASSTSGGANRYIGRSRWT